MNTNIKSFEDALALAGTDKEKEFFSNPELMSQFEPDEIAYKKMKIITRALNMNPETKELWIPDWTNYDQYKYYPWFEMDGEDKDESGVGFSYDDYDYDYSASYVGSRLCFESRDKAEYAGKTFLSIYKEFFVVKK